MRKWPSFFADKDKSWLVNFALIKVSLPMFNTLTRLFVEYAIEDLDWADMMLQNAMETYDSSFHYTTDSIQVHVKDDLKKISKNITTPMNKLLKQFCLKNQIKVEDWIDKSLWDYIERDVCIYVEHVLSTAMIIYSPGNIKSDTGKKTKTININVPDDFKRGIRKFSRKHELKMDEWIEKSLCDSLERGKRIKAHKLANLEPPPYTIYEIKCRPDILGASTIYFHYPSY